MKTLIDVKENLKKNFLMVEQIVNIGSDVGGLVLSFLQDLREKNSKISGFLPYKSKLDEVISIIEGVKDAPQLKAKYEIIRNQAAVLIVENFESFLNDCVKVLVDAYPGSIEWPEKKKVLPVSTDVLRYSVPTVEDLILASLKKEEVNFQDLQSTLRFFQEYLKIEIDLSAENRDRVIFAQAFRNIVVHNGSIVDHRFLAQVRNTSYASRFKDKQEILLSDEEYQITLKSFKDFSELIISKLSEKVS